MADDPFDSAAFLKGRGWVTPPPKPTFSIRWLFVVMVIAAVLFTGVGVVVRSSLVRKEREDYLRSHGARTMRPGFGVDLGQCSPEEAAACLEYVESTATDVDFVWLRKGQISEEVLEDFERRTKISATFRW